LLRYIETPIALESFALIYEKAAKENYTPHSLTSWWEFQIDLLASPKRWRLLTNASVEDGGSNLCTGRQLKHSKRYIFPDNDARSERGVYNKKNNPAVFF